jgi:hypothetical protein
VPFAFFKKSGNSLIILSFFGVNGAQIKLIHTLKSPAGSTQKTLFQDRFVLGSVLKKSSKMDGHFAAKMP